jgi:hypothetical protein
MRSALITFLAAIAASMPVHADDAATGVPVERSALDAEVQSLRREVVDLNRDLFMLEEDLLFPESTQVAVFVSMDAGTFFAVDSVQLKVDDKEVANYLYTEREQEALKRGGVQRLWLGNMKAGNHEVTAFFTGQGPHSRDYKRGTTLTMEKSVGAKFVVKVWE